MKKIPDWMRMKPTREIEFSEFESKKRYTFLLKGINNIEERVHKTTTYLIFDAIALEDYPTLSITKDKECKVHFSKICFQKQWWKMCQFDLNQEKEYNVFIVFERVNKDRFKIYQLERTN